MRELDIQDVQLLELVSGGADCPSGGQPGEDCPSGDPNDWWDVRYPIDPIP